MRLLHHACLQHGMQKNETLSKCNAPHRGVGRQKRRLRPGQITRATSPTTGGVRPPATRRIQFDFIRDGKRRHPSLPLTSRAIDTRNARVTMSVSRCILLWSASARAKDNLKIRGLSGYGRGGSYRISSKITGWGVIRENSTRHRAAQARMPADQDRGNCRFIAGGTYLLEPRGFVVQRAVCVRGHEFPSHARCLDFPGAEATPT